MQRKFLTNLLFLIFVNLLIKPFYIFGIDRTVHVTVETADYGLYMLLYNFSIVYYIILDLGLSNYNNRTISQQPHLLKSYLPNFLIIKTLLSFIYLGVVFGLAYSWGYRGVKLSLLFPFALNQILIGFILYFRSNITALHFFRWDAIISVFDRILVIIVCGVLLWGSVVPTFEIEYFVYAQTFAYALTALVSGTLVFRLNAKTHSHREKIESSGDLKSPDDYEKKGKFSVFSSLGSIFNILKESYPYALLVLFMTIYNRIDSIMLDKLLDDGLNQVGIYAAAYRLLDAVNIFGLLFGSLLLPIFARMLKAKDNIESLTFTAFKLILAFSVSVAICSATFGADIMTLLYQDNVTDIWVDVFELLIFSFIPVASVYIFGTLMTANANLWQLNIIAINGVILNVILNLLLIPKYEVYGATLATLITQSLVAIAHIIWSKYIFKLHFSTTFFIQIIGFVGLTIAFNYLALSQFNFHNWYIDFLFAATLTVFAAFGTKLIDLRAFVEMLKSRE
ncbi:MAG: polysaccharide biosynthesis C-terminal domain-containing protein [Saprospiraceae bacterium]